MVASCSKENWCAVLSVCERRDDLAVLRKKPTSALKTGMGMSLRFYGDATRTSVVPGPGQYELCSSIGGNMVRSARYHPRPLHFFSACVC